MELNKYINQLEEILKELSAFEKKGLDTSSLKLFIKNIKTFKKIQDTQNNTYSKNLSFNEKLEIIKAFLEDKKVFPRIKDVIEFANNELHIEFKDQKESRALTIKRIIGRIQRNPELKEKIKEAIIKIRNEKVHSQISYKTKKDIEKVESYTKWAEILSNL